MSAAVMGAGTHLKRPWEDDGDVPPSETARRTSFAMPSFATTLPLQVSAPTVVHPIERKLPPISTALEHSVDVTSLESPHSAFPKADRTSRLPPPPYSPPLGAPLKRIRYSSDRDLGLEATIPPNNAGAENPVSSAICIYNHAISSQCLSLPPVLTLSII